MFWSTEKQPAYQHDREIIQLIEKDWKSFEQEVRSKVGHLSQEYMTWRKRSYFAGAGLIAGAATFIGGGEWAIDMVKDVFGLPAGFAFVIFVLAITLIIFSGWVEWRWLKVNYYFTRALNPIMYEKAIQLLGLTAHHTMNQSKTLANESPRQKKIFALLEKSELITTDAENYSRYWIDDMVSAEYQGRILFMAELAGKFSSSQKTRRRSAFQGLFVMHTLPRSLEGKTFVTTEADQQGFGHIPKWHHWFKTEESPQETQLEWNDFENKLHVATTNETEARYILSTDFMQELYNWWSVRKGNIRLSFIGNQLFILYPDKNVRIGLSTASLNKKDLQHYLLSIVRPIWHVQKLMQHAESRLRRW